MTARLCRIREYCETSRPRPLAQFRPPSFSELLNFLINAVLRAPARLAETTSRTSTLHCERRVSCIVRQSNDKECFLLLIQYQPKAILAACVRPCTIGTPNAVADIVLRLSAIRIYTRLSGGVVYALSSSEHLWPILPPVAEHVSRSLYSA